MDVKRLGFYLGLFWTVMLCHACTGLFFQPTSDMPYSPAQFKLKHENLFIAVNKDVMLHAWLLHAHNPWATLLFLHGNSGNISADLGQIAWLPAYGVQVFLYDYRGFGQSGGVPKVSTSIADLNTILTYLRALPETPGKPLFVFGQSLGGSLAINGLAHSQWRSCISGLVTEGAFSSYQSVAQDHLAANWPTWLIQRPLSALFQSRFDPVLALSELDLPLLIIHGTADAVVPFAHGQRLYRMAAKPKAFWAIPDGGHADQARQPIYRDKIVDFMRQNAKTRC